MSPFKRKSEPRPVPTHTPQARLPLGVGFSVVRVSDISERAHTPVRSRKFQYYTLPLMRDGRYVGNRDTDPYAVVVGDAAVTLQSLTQASIAMAAEQAYHRDLLRKQARADAVRKEAQRKEAEERFLGNYPPKVLGS